MPLIVLIQQVKNVVKHFFGENARIGNIQKEGIGVWGARNVPKNWLSRDAGPLVLFLEVHLGILKH